MKLGARVLSIYAVAIILGILTGIVGSCFQLAIRYGDVLIAKLLSLVPSHGFSPAIVSVLISLPLILIAWFLVVKIAPEAAGSGVQEMEGVLLHQLPISWRRLLPVKFIGGVFAICSKLVVGREGPTIQMGGNLGAMLSELLHFSRERRDSLIAAGAAAGLATAFNAPLAGVLFVLEEMRKQFNFTFTNFKTVAICCVMATITLHVIMGPAPAIPMAVFALPSLRSLWLFFILGLIMGFVGLLFNILLMKTLALTDHFSFKQRLIYVFLVALGIGYLAYAYPTVVGGGYRIIEEALNVSPSIMLLVIVMVIRFFTTLICYSLGTPGGIFAPLLALGTLMGTVLASFLQGLMPDLTIHPGMFAVAGMGALFSASIRAPITGIVLVVEMTQNYSLILPLMVSCLTSTTVVQLARNEPIYTQLLRRTLRRQGVST